MQTITAARWISLLAAFIWGAVAEFHLATAVGADQYTAVLLPVVLDVYGFAAMRAARTPHIAGALVTMFATQMVSHLLTMGEAPRHMVALAIGVSAIPPAVSLACHRLGVERVTATATEQISAYTLDTPAEAPGYTVHAAVESSVADAPANGKDVPLSKVDFAKQGAALIAEGHTKTSAAEVLGISRQWLHACMRDA